MLCGELGADKKRELEKFCETEVWEVSESFTRGMKAGASGDGRTTTSGKGFRSWSLMKNDLDK